MIVFLIIVLLIFLVPVLNLGGIPVRLEDLFFLGIIFSAPKGVLAEIFKTKQKRVFISLMVLFFVSNLVSLSWAILRGYMPIIGDFNTIFSLFRNIIIIVAGLIFGKSLNVSFSKLLIFLSIGPIVSSIVSLIQYFNIGGMGAYLYLRFSNVDNLWYSVVRAVGIYGNPNYAAFFQAIGLACLLWIGWPKNFISKLILFFLIALSFMSILVTFSRTGLIAAVLCILVFLIIKRKIILLFFIGFILTIAIIPNIPKLISNTRFSTIAEEDKAIDVTMSGRSDEIWAKKLEKLYVSPFFGIGPAKSDESDTAFATNLYDSSFFYLLITTGIVGCLIIMIFFFYEIKYFYTLKNSLADSIFTYFLSINIIVIIFFITTDLFASPIFSSFFYFSIGTFVSYSMRINDQHSPENIPQGWPYTHRTEI